MEYYSRLFSKKKEMQILVTYDEKVYKGLKGYVRQNEERDMDKVGRLIQHLEEKCMLTQRQVRKLKQMSNSRRETSMQTKGVNKVLLDILEE